MSDVRGSLAAVIASAAAEPTEAEQLALIPTRFKPDDASGQGERVRDAVQRHRAGRPPGARNLATRQALDYVRRVIGDPLLERARMAMHTPESLSIELGCTKLEAARFLDDIRADLQRLFYAPLAPVDDKGNAVVPFFGVSIGGAAQAGPGAEAPWEYLKRLPGQVIENAPNSEAQPDVSHNEQSHDPLK